MKIVLAAALATLATPALADPLAPASSPTVAPMPSAADSGQRYCMVIAKQTGSFIDRRVCRTRADWLKTGVDPLTMRK